MSDGTVYTIALFRGTEEDSPAATGSALSGIEQVAAELQEAMDEYGLPVGFFQVTEARPATWAEWDAIKDAAHPPVLAYWNPDAEAYEV